MALKLKIKICYNNDTTSPDILTLPSLAIEKAWLTNLVEEKQKELPSSEQSITVPIKPFGIATVRLQVRSR